MAGHSHWAGIKHKKEKLISKDQKYFSKLSKEITVAAKLGDKDPSMNRDLDQQFKPQDLPICRRKY